MQQHPLLVYWVVFAILLFIIIFLDKKYDLLRDESSAPKKPYSYSRSQLAWWTLVIMSLFITIFITRGNIPALANSTVILLGISAATTAAGRLIDVGDATKPLRILSQETNGDNFFIDILSDNNGVSIHRLQTVIFNMVIGAWFITCALHNLMNCVPAGCCSGTACIDTILPDVSDNVLMLLGISSGTYAAIKSTENKTSPPSGGITAPGAVSVPPVSPGPVADNSNP
ncbi:hypothetical protein [Sediminibacterium ginsengisoli]|uniref:Uncharacterized protein n=1 Tax=Sediminibacterium ginsengisoli TaxID=413434 RepID=A0A1T4L5H4_9BACT|nr:hypothetical protein [Sediminibacterium ginsengisoli]SJZ49989.1 hypothetical protein SAMN04488132_102315 [Sediminibacterium ginsengisoli]